LNAYPAEVLHAEELHSPATVQAEQKSAHFMHDGLTHEYPS
jgi:hypothetical protein